ncbi:MAG: glycosyl hydrolase family 28-related protein [Tepidisphaeraceae bacterium]|jgi:polygalacturonase
MKNIILRLGLLLIVAMVGGCQSANGIFSVRDFGASGDGKHLDTQAVNKAIDAAANAGGGTVYFAPGAYICYSIHLKSNVSLYLENGAVIQAAGTIYDGQFDPPESFPFADQYQDFGHSHWHNSLIWGENIRNVAILGPGMIDGKDALNRGWPKPPATTQPTTEPWQDTTQPSDDTQEPWEVEVGSEDIRPGPVTQPWLARRAPWRWATSRISPDIPSEDYQAMYAATQPATEPTTLPATQPDYPNEKDTLPSGIGNKAIALKNVHNVILRDFSIYEGGHFGILATAVDGLTIDNVKIDTNRDGMDIDCCRNVRVSNCSVNSPHDDAIVLKSSFGLGYARDTENVTIANCLVSGGYVEGSMLDGTFQKIGPANSIGNDKKHYHTTRTGRIKFGTESNGGFKNIAISNCVLDDCAGLAIESVDGGVIDNLSISNIVMRDVTSAPLFIRLGSRLRGPKGTPMGAIRHVSISDVVSQSIASRYACIIAGVPGYEIEDVHIHNMRLIYPGGGKGSWTRREPWEQVKGYPEPSKFGGMPAYGFFIRHVSGLELTNVDMNWVKPDVRPPFILEDVQHSDLRNVTATVMDHGPMLILRGVKDFRTRDVSGVGNMHLEDVGEEDY